MEVSLRQKPVGLADTAPIGKLLRIVDCFPIVPNRLGPFVHLLIDQSPCAVEVVEVRGQMICRDSSHFLVSELKGLLVAPQPTQGGDLGRNRNSRISGVWSVGGRSEERRVGKECRSR